MGTIIYVGAQNPLEKAQVGGGVRGYCKVSRLPSMPVSVVLFRFAGNSTSYNNNKNIFRYEPQIIPQPTQI